MYAELLRDNVVIEVKIKSLTITKLCSEDFCAYTEDVNPKPEGTRTNLRSAGQIDGPENIEIYLKNRSKTVNELYYKRCNSFLRKKNKIVSYLEYRANYNN